MKANLQQNTRFGIIAVQKGFITPRQLGEAVTIQMQEDLQGIRHRRLGEILCEKGFLSLDQVEEILEIIRKPVIEDET